MLDVHPAHHAATTWRDFFIHIATIVFGLLIAVGLEQTVEAVHRAHERNVLIEDIHAEAEHNLPVFDDNIKANSQQKAWLKASIAGINSAISQSPAAGAAGHGPITVTLPPLAQFQGERAPSRAVWSVAQSNGKVALLPENLAEVYDRLDYDAEQFFQARNGRFKVEVQMTAFETRFGVAIKPGVTLHLEAAAYDELSRLLARYYAACNNDNDWTAYWAGAADAVLHNAQSRDKMTPYLDRHHASLPQ